jgi:acyl-coenzyme A synthetase/AMP-(fatty) acid ligase
MNLVDQILFQARYHPPTAAICAPGRGIGLISYGRLEVFINNICRRALSLGIARGQVVAVVIDDIIFHAATLLALMHLGVITVSVPDENMPRDLKIDAIISDKKLPIPANQRLLLADLSWTEGEGKAIDRKWVADDLDDDICRIILTSGTTGAPKAVAITHRMLADRMRRNASAFGERFPRCSRIFIGLSLGTSFGFQFLIQTLLRGGMAFFAGASFEATLEAFENYKVECWLTTPSGLTRFLQGYEECKLYPSRLELLIYAGDALPKSLANQARARICSHLISGYGSTEMGAAAAAPLHAIANVPGAVGYVVPGASVEIVDETGVALPAGRNGSIRIRTPYGASAYLANPDETAKVFREGWFYPGEAGELTADGLLIVTGRQTGILNLGGEKINPEVVERVLCAFPGIEQAAVFGISAGEMDNPTVGALVVTRAEIDENRLREHCLNYLARAFVPSRIVRVPAIPRTAAGKIDRQLIAETAKSRAAR